MGLKLSHIDTSDPAGPVIHVRYDRAGKEYKERRLRLPPAWARTLRSYLREYSPQDTLFDCTARNLEYVLAKVATLAGIPGGLSFETLRWTCAVRDYRARMESDRLRQKLGLSQMSWQETEPRIVRLAEPPL
jgi:integrase/recombinase XerD